MDYDDYDPDNPFDETNANNIPLPNETFAPPLPFAPPPPRNPQYPPLPSESDSFLPPPPPSSFIPPPPMSDENFLPQPPPPEDSYLQPAPPSDESNYSHISNFPSHSYSSTITAPPTPVAIAIDKSEQMKYLKIQQEKEEHERLIQAENLKRKTIIKPVIASFMKSKRIKGFEVESDDDEEEAAVNNSKRVKKEDTTGKTTVNTKSKTTDNNTTTTATASKNKETLNSSSSISSTNESSEGVSPELLTMLTKTAAWVVDNPDKAHILIEKSRHNAQMFFLFDRHSPAGIKYLEELSRYKAEKEVHDIFHGAPSVLEQQQQQQQLLLHQQQLLLQQQQAGMYQAKPVVPPPPLPPTTSFSSSIVSSDEINRAKATAVSLAMNAVALKMQQQLQQQLPPPPPLVATLFPPQSHAQAQTLIVSTANTTSATADVIRADKNDNAATTVAVETTTVSGTGGCEGWKPKRKSRWDSSSTALASCVDIITNNTSSSVTAHSAAPPQLTVPVYHDIKASIPKSHHQHQQQYNDYENKSDNKTNAINTNIEEDDELQRQREKAKWDFQIREQKELQLLESRIRSATAAAGKGNNSTREEALYQERLKEYQELASRYEEDMHFKDTLADAEANDGVIEGGTWEHRKRAKEMLDTAQRNLEATAIAAGRTHMGDYLPAHILDQFLKKSEALKTGGSAGLKQLLDAEKHSSGGGGSGSRDYKENKLQSDNVGYQMLAKAGWSEGQALGSSIVNNSTTAAGSSVSSDGIKVEGSSGINAVSSSTSSTSTRLLEPLAATGQQGSESFGVGVSATYEVTAGDDEFDQYRKRMMLAYRFRPNPMNNPRRDYY